jgi:hypothetical protein
MVKDDLILNVVIRCCEASLSSLLEAAAKGRKCDTAMNRCHGEDLSL